MIKNKIKNKCHGVPLTTHLKRASRYSNIISLLTEGAIPAIVQYKYVKIAKNIIINQNTPLAIQYLASAIRLLKKSHRYHKFIQSVTLIDYYPLAEFLCFPHIQTFHLNRMLPNRPRNNSLYILNRLSRKSPNIASVSIHPILEESFPILNKYKKTQSYSFTTTLENLQNILNGISGLIQINKNALQIKFHLKLEKYVANFEEIVALQIHNKVTQQIESLSFNTESLALPFLSTTPENLGSIKYLELNIQPQADFDASGFSNIVKLSSLKRLELVFSLMYLPDIVPILSSLAFPKYLENIELTINNLVDNFRIDSQMKMFNSLLELEELKSFKVNINNFNPYLDLEIQLNLLKCCLQNIKGNKLENLHLEITAKGKKKVIQDREIYTLIVKFPNLKSLFFSTRFSLAEPIQDECVLSKIEILRIYSNHFIDLIKLIKFKFLKTLSLTFIEEATPEHHSLVLEEIKKFADTLHSVNLKLSLNVGSEQREIIENFITVWNSFKLLQTLEVRFTKQKILTDELPNFFKLIPWTPFLTSVIIGFGKCTIVRTHDQPCKINYS